MVLLFRSFAKPPQAVQDISECIVVMRGYKDVSWKTAKGMMAEGNFLKTLQVGGGGDGCRRNCFVLCYSALVSVM